MATNPRDWPNNAKSARDQSSEQANRALRALRPVLDRYNTMAKEELLHRVAIAIDADQTIARLLERQGAPTLPDEL
jgi:hypothetical protein